MQPAPNPSNCNRCGKNTRIGGTEHCSRCLCEVVENRAKKRLDRIALGTGKESPKDKITVICDDEASLTCKTAAYLAKKLCKTGHVLTTRHASQKAANGNTVILAQCADDTATGFLEILTSNKFQQPKSKAKLARIFESVTEKELELYAAIKRIKYKKGNSSDLKNRLQRLQERYPGTVEALAKSGRRIGET